MTTVPTMTRIAIADHLIEQTGMARNEALQFVESVLEQVCGALEAGENVKISGFGTFSLRDKQGRIGRNPKTGEEVPISPRRVILFKPSQILRERVINAPESAI